MIGRTALLAVLVALPTVAAAQVGYRLRLDTRVQGVSYRGVTFDSIPVGDTVAGPGGGPATPDGYAVTCVGGDPYCTYFRPGPERRAAPFTTLADLSLWGIGISGLRLHALARVGLELGDAASWPGTDPAMQLLEGYLEYARPRVTLRAGRVTTASRLGTTGLDGGRVAVRDRRTGIEAEVFGGWGLERGTALPVTSPALNPLDDYQPRRRFLVAGLGAGWLSPRAELRADYLREVDPRSDHFVSERIGLQTVVRPAVGLSVEAGGDYDLAAGWWGSAEATIAYGHRLGHAAVGVRRYRPHFPLWTIWGAFSPVPYEAWHLRASARVLPQVTVHARYERYAFDDAEAQTPLARAERDGWRWSAGVNARPAAAWTFDAGYQADFGPGAAAAGLSASLRYAPQRPYEITVYASSLDRPLEFRYNEAQLRVLGLEAEGRRGDRLRVALGVSHYAEDRNRPDAAALDWNQLRIHTRITWVFGGGVDDAGLPDAVRQMPDGPRP